MISDVMADYRDLAERYGVDVSIEVPPLEMTSDGEMLWYLFSNLVSNALKFRATKGRAGMKIRAAAGDGIVTVRVEDNGIGLSDAEKDRIFDRFFQGTPSTEGSGVGLTICRMIARELRGDITLTSAGKNRGTVAVVTLPGG